MLNHNWRSMLTVSLVVIAGLLLAAVPCLAQAQKKTLVEEDSRLQREVTLTMLERPVYELLTKLSDLTAVKLQVKQELRERKLTAIVRGVQVGSLMAQVAYLFDWGWRRVTDGDQITYRLETRAGSRDRAQRLRDNIVDSAIQQLVAEEWQTVQPLLETWIDNDGVMEDIASADPEAAKAIEADPDMPFKLDRLANMPSDSRYPWLAGQVRLDYALGGPDTSYAMVDTYASKQRIVKSSTPKLATKVDLKLLKAAPLSEALLSLSKAARLNVLADAYSRKSQVDPSEWEQAPITGILNDMANEARYDWTDSAGFVRLRSRTWFLDELQDVPERIAKRWKDLRDKQGRLYFQDYLGLVRDLNADQLAGLADPSSKYGLTQEAAMTLQYLSHFVFYGSLTASQRAAALIPPGIAMSRMSQDQQDAFFRLMSLDRTVRPPLYRPGAFFGARIGSNGADVAYLYNVQGMAPWERQIVMPGSPVPATPATTPEAPSAPENPANEAAPGP